MKPFTTEQLFLISQGKIKDKMLKDYALQSFGLIKNISQPKRHWYIQSPPGAGKTFTVQTVADAHPELPIVKIQGAQSMSAFVVKLAVTLYIQQDEITVWVDDCDSLFHELDNLNIMKGILDEDRNILAYNKNLTNQILSYEKSSNPAEILKATALRTFMPEGSVGVEIPTDRLRFIITSNMALCEPNKVVKRQHLISEQAIRDRVNYRGFDLMWKESWGWIAFVLLNNDLSDVKLTEEQKYILLDFMFTNWSRLPSVSIRAVKDLGALMLNELTDYPDHWNALLSKEAA